VCEHFPFPRRCLPPPPFTACSPLRDFFPIVATVFLAPLSIYWAAAGFPFFFVLGGVALPFQILPLPLHLREAYDGPPSVFPLLREFPSFFRSATTKVRPASTSSRKEHIILFCLSFLVNEKHPIRLVAKNLFFDTPFVRPNFRHWQRGAVIPPPPQAVANTFRLW